MGRLEGGEAARFELAAGAMARLEGRARFDQAARAVVKEWQFGHSQSERRHDGQFQPGKAGEHPITTTLATERPADRLSPGVHRLLSFQGTTKRKQCVESAAASSQYHVD